MIYLTTVDIAELRLSADKIILAGGNAETLHALIDSYEDMQDAEPKLEDLNATVSLNEELSAEVEELKEQVKRKTQEIKQLKLKVTKLERFPSEPETGAES